MRKSLYTFILLSLPLILITFLCLFLSTAHVFAATSCTGTDNSPCGNSFGAVCCTTGYTCVQRTAGKGGSIQICTANVNLTQQAGSTGLSTSQSTTVVDTPIAPPPPPCATAITNGGCASVSTAFGAWSTEPALFVKSLFSILLSISGGIAVLSIIFAGYKMIMSQGDPEKIQGAREQLTSSIIGLLFLIFSLVILEVIGVDILHLPGFNH